ncbi:MAG: hypothetical protein PHV47_01560 [Candidatus Pacebacteria bacterium]|nr:hypothetical protein [Candidatus Paceibacterota bacterium]MDD5621239.1 hypothetical protein [Candidatus Paceibacterota bacterium]
MAIIFAKGNKRQIYSIIILVILIIIFVSLIVVLVREKPTTMIVKNEIMDLPIVDFENLQTPLLQRLDPFFFTPDIVGIMGRDNPFASLFPATSTKK